jgi:arylformamidase
MSSNEWIDVSVMLKHNMVSWPGDPPVFIERLQDMERGDEATLSRLSMGLHTGTHVDAPLHFVPKGKTIAEMPLDVMTGPARVVGIASDVVSAESIRANAIEPGERVLFKTRNSSLWLQSEFEESFVHLSTEAALELSQCGVRLVGIDYLSVAGFRNNEVEVHRALLEAGIWLVEGLDLSRVEPGDIDLLCLPLKIESAEGAPARVLLRPAR